MSSKLLNLAKISVFVGILAFGATGQSEPPVYVIIGSGTAFTA